MQTEETLLVFQKVQVTLRTHTLQILQYFKAPEDFFFFFFYFSVCHMKVKCYLQQSFYPLAGSLSLHQTAQGITDIFRIQLALVYLKNPYLTSSLLISKLAIPRSFPSQLFIIHTTDKDSGHFWRRRNSRIC